MQFERFIFSFSRRSPKFQKHCDKIWHDPKIDMNSIRTSRILCVSDRVGMSKNLSKIFGSVLDWAKIPVFDPKINIF